MFPGSLHQVQTHARGQVRRPRQHAHDPLLRPCLAGRQGEAASGVRATLLDYVLGDEHDVIYRRAELKVPLPSSSSSPPSSPPSSLTLTLTSQELTAQHMMDEDGHGTLTRSPLSRSSCPLPSPVSSSSSCDLHGAQDEVRILNGTLDMAGKAAKDAMRPLKDVYMIEASSPLDRTTLRNIMATGFSRIPVYHNDVQNVIGMLLVKDLLLVNPDDAVSVGWSERGLIRGIRRVPESLPLFDLLHLFRKGTSRLALVCRPKQEGKGPDDGSITGIVTLEDVIEELIQEEILDETDQGVDVVAMLAHQFAQKQLNEQRRTGRSKAQKEIRASRSERVRREMSDSVLESDVWKPIALASLMKTRCLESLPASCCLSLNFPSRAPSPSLSHFPPLHFFLFLTFCLPPLVLLRPSVDRVSLLLYCNHTSSRCIHKAHSVSCRHGDHSLHSHLRLPVDHASSASPVVGARYLPHEMSKPPHRGHDDL
eukprot:761596-Hanusia_phi.AAC.7